MVVCAKGCVLADWPEPIEFLGDASALLKRVGPECEARMEDLVLEFEALAACVTEIILLSSKTAQSIESGAIPLIPAKTENLVQRTEEFVRDRLEATAAVLEAVRCEQEILEKLEHHNAANRSIAQEIRMLSLLTSMEVARMGESGCGFQYLARELSAASETVSGCAREIAERARTRKVAIQQSERKMDALLPRLRRQFGQVERQLHDALGEVKASIGKLSACPSQVKGCADSVAFRISGVVSAIQTHDITRQQTEHVRDTLAKMAAQLRAPKGAPRNGELALGLRVQALQLENIKQSMEMWSSHIDDCLESILQVSQSRLEYIAPAVLRQEEQLSARLLEIEGIERTCEMESAEIAEGFSGLSSLGNLVGEHVRLAHTTRDGLQLLSFNSIVESRNLGIKADVVLEISRNITRISAQWGQMAEKSEETKTEIQTLIDRTHEGIALLSNEKDDLLQAVRVDIAGALEELKAAAHGAARNGAKLAELTAGLRERTEAARAISQSLKKIAACVFQSMEKVDAVRRSPAALGGEAECDLAALEAQCSECYTTEIERSILRAGLYGEVLPEAAGAIAGNDVELF